MRAGGGNVPWPIVAAIIVVALLALNGFAGFVIPLLFAAGGGWLVVTAVQGLRAPGKVTYWRGQRIVLEEGRPGERVGRAAVSIVLGLTVIAVCVWYLLFR